MSATVGRVPSCPECGAPLDDEHTLRSGAVCSTLEPDLPGRTRTVVVPGVGSVTHTAYGKPGRSASRSPFVEWWAQEKWPTSADWDYVRPFTTYDDGAAYVVATREKFPDGKFRLVERRVTEEITYA